MTKNLTGTGTRGLFKLEGPDEEGCVWICSVHGPEDWRHKLGPRDQVFDAFSQWLSLPAEPSPQGAEQPERMRADGTVETVADLERHISQAGGGPHYVYVLRWPRDMAASGEPFYVGIGKGTRLFSHEEEARDGARDSAKLRVIRQIWDAGKEVLRTIDSVHTVEPWDREEELINEIGRLADGTGPLTNYQTYSRSMKVAGVELRKYAADHAATGDVNSVPPRFKLRGVRLMAGPRKPISSSSVFGKIYRVAEMHPGVTGEELIRLLQSADFSGNKSAYTQSGKVSASWLAGYIEGAYFRSDRQHLQDYRPESRS